MIEKTSSDLKKDEKLKVKGRKKSAGVQKGRESFHTALGGAIKFEFEGTIEELLTELRDQERRFLDTQSQYDLQRYKAVVQKILKSILEEGFATATLKRHRRDRSDFLVVKRIDSKLMEITDAITRRNKAFDLLKKIEEIRGMLLDLLS